MYYCKLLKNKQRDYHLVFDNFTGSTKRIRDLLSPYVGERERVRTP